MFIAVFPNIDLQFKTTSRIRNFGGYCFFKYLDNTAIFLHFSELP